MKRIVLCFLIRPFEHIDLIEDEDDPIVILSHEFVQSLELLIR